MELCERSERGNSGISLHSGLFRLSTSLLMIPYLLEMEMGEWEFEIAEKDSTRGLSDGRERERRPTLFDD